MPRSSNASASAFGWDFQINAAIVLMINNIREAFQVTVEGKTEDIEIKFSNGQQMMVQAKAVNKPDDYGHVKSNLEASLKTLNNASKLPDVNQLAFITNSPNPFRDKSTMYQFSSPFNVVGFMELPQSCQDVISNICLSNGYGLEKEKLKIYVLQFYGESLDERYKVVYSCITEFLNTLGAYNLSKKKMMNFWQNQFFQSATKSQYTIKKADMI